MMDKADNSRESSKWASLDRNILAIVFDKLEIMDITMGASRVCISWFLVSHDKTLWNTIDLAKLQHKGENVLYNYKHKVNSEIIEEATSFSNLLTKIINFFSNFCKIEGIRLTNLLIEITKLSRNAPKNLFFHCNSYIQNQDLVVASERMPNIEKLALPVSWYFNEKSFRFAFSQWKNLKTLIMARSDYYSRNIKFRIVGENCSNLTNLKIMSRLDERTAKKIVLHLQGLKWLSLRCSLISVEGVISLIKGLGNLRILNLTHCIYFSYNLITKNDVVQAATKKLDKLITCSENDCKVCKDRRGMSGEHDFYDKQWRKDEIKELEF